MKHNLDRATMAVIACGILAGQVSAPLRTFVNPLLPSGPDPFITWRAGFYFYMNTTGNSLAIRKSRSLAGLRDFEPKIVWRASGSGPHSHGVWAPELHFLRGKWYIYFAADEGTNASHRIWVLENGSPDPLDGDWILKGKVGDPSDRWAIDATVFEQGSRLYMVWSGWPADHNGVQNLYIGELSEPWILRGSRVLISTPEFPWEKVGDLNPGRDREENPGLEVQNPLHVDVNEGPAVLRKGGRVFLVYSASGCWTDRYSLGMLTADASANLLDRASWRKSSIPVFWQSPRASAYGPGHNSFFQSPDGAEDWIVYHANPEPGQGCGTRRAPHAQRVAWKADGTPDFGRPIAPGIPIPPPSGEQ